MRLGFALTAACVKVKPNPSLMVDMEALFAEMRKAQTGGVDFAARETKAAAAGDDESDSDTSDTPPGDSHLLPKAMEREETRSLISASEFGKKRKKQDMRTAADPGTEAARHRAISQIASVFESACGKTLGGRWWSHFENWLYSRRSAGVARLEKRRQQKGREGYFNSGDDDLMDPVLPDVELAKSDFALDKKLASAGLSKYEIIGVGLELSKATQKAHAMLTREHSGKRKFTKMSTPFEVGGKKESGLYERKEGDDDGGEGAKKVTLTHGKVSLEINLAHLEKLKALHSRYAVTSSNGAKGDDVHSHHFKDDLFSLLCRYQAVQGGHYKAGTMQAAVPGEFLDKLNEIFGVTMELCASPLNCHWRRYCSSYLDVDAPFGSLGDLFKFKPTRGSFEANPPFDQAFIAKMTKHFEKLLESSDTPLSFTVVIPHWPEERCWQNLTSSRFLTQRLTLKKGTHGFIAGGQQTRVKRTTPSAAATDVIFLQNANGKKKWPVTDTKLKALKKAFAFGLKSAKGKDDKDSAASDSDTETHEKGGSDVELNGTNSEASALKLSKGKIWDPDAFLFWGVGSGKRWGKQPSEWILNAAGEFLEEHWVGEDPESEEEEEEEEEWDEGEEVLEGEGGEDEESESDVELHGEDGEESDDDDVSEGASEDASDDTSDDISADDSEDVSDDEDMEESDASDEESGSEEEETPPRKNQRLTVLTFVSD